MLILVAAGLLLSSAALAVMTVSITVSPAPPIPYGRATTWTATASGGTPPYTYEFWRLDGSTWVLVQAYSSNNKYTWTPSAADDGSHQISVWALSAGSGNPYDAYKMTAVFKVVKPTTITAFTANRTFPLVFGNAITWTVTATAIPGPAEYEFWQNNLADGKGWVLAQAYSSSRTYKWTPGSKDLGLHDVVVWARNVGSPADYEDARDFGQFNISGTVTAPAVTVTPAGSKPAGQPITFTGSATGNPGPLECEFWRLDGSAWVLGQAYSSACTYQWIPGVGDQNVSHDVSVWFRNVGSQVNYENYKTAGTFNIAPPQPLAVSNFQSYPPVPKPQGSILYFQPTTTGGMYPLQYQFWKYNVQTGVWSIVQSYSASPVFNWTPTAADVGNYQMSVWVKNNGSSAQYDAFFVTPQFAITPPTTDIVRFLEQATWGPTDAEIERVRTMGMSAWIDDQFAQAPTGYPAFTPVTDNAGPNCNGNCQRDNYSMYPMQIQFFKNAFYGNDQLRQRVAFALHSLVVTSGLDLPLPSWSQPYHAVIYNDALGNYWNLLYDVTLVPAMGDYLNMRTSTVNNPNENYAREVMQLFSVGTGLLNIDGTYQTQSDGTIIPTYDQFTVTEFARALTGWHFASNIGPGITNYRDTMIATAANHDTGSKQLLSGFTTAAGQTAAQDLTDVINNLFNHPNVGPYIARHLIRQLVTSNPSPGYISRVATVFNDNGSGVRGDMKAVVKALLLDTEARYVNPVSHPAEYGHLKSPVLLITHLLRAMNVRAASGSGQSDGYLAPNVRTLGQDILQPPTVFSYYPADYELPGTSTASPEYGIFQTVTTLKRANFVNTMVFSNIPTSANAPNGTSIDLSVLTAIAGNPEALVKELDRILLHDYMSSQMKTSILSAINAISPSKPLLRAQTALYLVATSSQYQVER